jgi:hypothetical protein
MTKLGEGTFGRVFFLVANSRCLHPFQ